jgi:hypothetical protein
MDCAGRLSRFLGLQTKSVPLSQKLEPDEKKIRANMYLYMTSE